MQVETSSEKMYGNMMKKKTQWLINTAIINAKRLIEGLLRNEVLTKWRDESSLEIVQK